MDCRLQKLMGHLRPDSSATLAATQSEIPQGLALLVYLLLYNVPQPLPSDSLKRVIHRLTDRSLTGVPRS